MLCTFVGKNTTAKFTHKLKYYQCLTRFNLLLKQNLMYKQDNLLKLLDFNFENSDFKTSLQSLKIVKYNESTSNELYFPEYLETEDIAFLTNYFTSLGRGNLDSEMENLLFYENEINEKVDKIADKNSKFSNLGQKLGFAIGMTVFIVILWVLK